MTCMCISCRLSEIWKTESVGWRHILSLYMCWLQLLGHRDVWTSETALVNIARCRDVLRIIFLLFGQKRILADCKSAIGLNRNQIIRFMFSISLITQKQHLVTHPTNYKKQPSFIIFSLFIYGIAADWKFIWVYGQICSLLISGSGQQYAWSRLQHMPALIACWRQNSFSSILTNRAH